MFGGGECKSHSRGVNIGVDDVEGEVLIRGKCAEVPAEERIVAGDSGALGREVRRVAGGVVDGSDEGGTAVGCEVVFLDVDESD